MSITYKTKLGKMSFSFYSNKTNFCLNSCPRARLVFWHTWFDRDSRQTTNKDDFYQAFPFFALNKRVFSIVVYICLKFLENKLRNLTPFIWKINRFPFWFCIQEFLYAKYHFYEYWFLVLQFVFLFSYLKQVTSVNWTDAIVL